MKKKIRLRAEDILNTEDFSKSTLSEIQENTDDISKNEILIVSQVYSFLTSDQGIFPESEKELIKKRLEASINRFKWKRLFLRISTAAAVLLFLGVTGIWYSQMDSTPDIVNFAQTLSESTPEKDTRLILQGGQEVLINKEESKISYDQNGKNITIGGDQTVVQDISPHKSRYNTVIVPYGKRTMITLSEGTKVWLNSGSKLIYPAVFYENKREVYIEGEAVFEVTHSESKPFHVSTRDFEVKVLGTIFNISAYSDDKYSSTVLDKGKVELSYKGNSISGKGKFAISPGTMAVFDPDKKDFTQQKVNPQDYMSWHNGYLIFNREKLITILKKLTRYYNVEIQLQNIQLQNETFSGNLDLKNTPEQVLDVIAQTTPFNYEYQNNKLVITSKN